MLKNGGYIDYRSKFAGKPIFPHGFQGIFISPQASIGKNSIILQQVTIGVKGWSKSECNAAPVIGDNVLIGAGAKILGGITVGDNCKIGANAVVVHNLLPSSVVYTGCNLVKKKDIDNRYFVRHSDGWYVYKDGILIKDISETV